MALLITVRDTVLCGTAVAYSITSDLPGEPVHGAKKRRGSTLAKASSPKRRIASLRPAFASYIILRPAGNLCPAPRGVSVLVGQKDFGPETLRVVVNGLQCNCNSDLVITVRANDDPASDAKYGSVYGEVKYVPHVSGHYLPSLQFKRLHHKQKSDNILGQEVAHLLSIAALQRQGTRTRRLRSDKRPERSTKPVIVGAFPDIPALTYH